MKLLEFIIYGDGSSEYEMDSRFDEAFYKHIEQKLNDIELEILEHFEGEFPQNTTFNHNCHWKNADKK